MPKPTDPKKSAASKEPTLKVGHAVVVRGQGAGLLREHKQEPPKDEYVVDLEQGTVRIASKDAASFLRLPMDRKSADGLLRRMCDATDGERTLAVLTSSRMFTKLEPAEQAEYVRLLLRFGEKLSLAEKQIVAGGEHVLLSEMAAAFGVGMGAVRDAVHRGDPSVTSRASEVLKSSRRA
ncbi:MAG: hypothetical protein U0169_19560 [Polyangiaceae bacterium]